MLTVKELQEARIKLELDISNLLNSFTAETGYSIESINLERRLSERYYNGIYTSLGYLVVASVDISTEYKLRIGDLVKADTWIDGKDSNANR